MMDEVRNGSGILGIWPIVRSKRYGSGHAGYPSARHRPGCNSLKSTQDS